ncbi:MAG: leucyl aminopeptidase [Candidatus Omnitrophica bacterium]|nr:leucyl aminopeptidase [Candidatus Omnitrophota bacterium]
MIKFHPTAKFDKDASVIFLNKEQAKSKTLSGIVNSKIREQILALIKNEQFQADEGEVFPLALGKQKILFVGMGDRSKLTPTSLRKLARQAVLSSYLKKVKDVEWVTDDQKDETIIGVIEGILIGGYSWDKYRSGEQKVAKTHHIIAAYKPAYDDTLTVCKGVSLTRDLINDNADVVTSTYLEKVVRGLVKDHKNVSLEILNEKEMKAVGLGLHLAVNQGSNKEPKLIIVRYQGANAKKEYDVALVGKGMTYDTGGLNIKTTGHMEAMRMDMSGAAAVIGTLHNALALKLKKNVLFVMPIAENAIDANSYKPGDVIRGYDGKTVEIGNTDAEGRLVLADAFSYVIKNYKPKTLVDIATLTGAVIVALGHDYSGLVSCKDELANQLLRAAEETDDRVWRLPSYPEIKDAVKSLIADIRNTGWPKGAGGTITAAEFLRQFTPGTPWAHLDIAGTAFNDGKGRLYYGHGATGAGVRLMTRYLINS